MVTNSYKIGINAEVLAKNYLIKNGYKILNERFKTKFGEIDLIALINNIIVFIEVKKRKDISQLFETINVNQQQRIYNAALEFLKNGITNENDYRFDAIFIDALGKITHIENIIIE